MFHSDIPIQDAPEWLSVLIACDEWGCPPWEVMPGYATRRWWFAARNFVAREKVRAYKDKSK